MKLFHAWLSSASRRVRLCLAEKRMPYESVPVDLARQQQHTPEFLAMNPQGVVPALEVAPGRFLYESATLCEYLDELQPEPPLRPHDPYERARMRNFVRWTDEQLLPCLLILNWSLMLQPTASRWSDAELQQRLARIPTAERRLAWQRIARQPYSTAEKQEALGGLLQLVDRMEQLLSDGPHLFGNAYSLADIAAAPFIARIAELRPDALSAGAHPRVAAWWQALQQREAFVAARFDRFDVAQAERDQTPSAGRPAQ